MSRWPQVRAALITWHLLAITLSALPSPEGGLNRANWADPTVQTEFKAWSARFGMDPKEFEDRLWTFAEAYNKGYGVLLTPVRPYEDLVGSEQSWKMFVAPHRFPARLQISARNGDGGEWEVLFEESSPTATWNAPVLRLERLRSAIFRWSWPNYQSAWSRACTALARQVFEDRPEAGEVRCRFWKAASPSPQEVLTQTQPEGTWVLTRLVKRGPDGLPLTASAASTAPSGASTGKAAPADDKPGDDKPADDKPAATAAPGAP